MKYPLLLVLFFSFNLVAKEVNDIEFSSGDHQNLLIELFTSQGCSSCPPADNWLNSFKDNPQLFKKIIPMAFHVDYWDYLGWKDSFSKKDYSARQRAHYDVGHIVQVYTPVILKNNREIKRGDLYNKESFKKLVGNLTVHILDKKVLITFDPTNKKKNLTAHVALLGIGFEEKIYFGENKDKRLMHDFVVLEHEQKKSKENSWSIDLPTSKIKAKKYAIAVWVTDRHVLDLVQITADWLPSK
jgi:hypothetical protein